MNWNIYSAADALLILSLTDHNVCAQLSVRTYYFTFYFFFPKYTFPYIDKVHTPVPWRAVEHFAVVSKALNNLALHFPAPAFTYHSPVTPISHSSLDTSLSTVLPNRTRVHVHPECLVRLCPSSHPPFLTIIPLCSMLETRYLHHTTL